MEIENNDVIKDCIKFIMDFLVKNGFKVTSENTLRNEKCLIVILKNSESEHEDDYYYEIYYNDEDYDDVSTVSDSLNICWLIGFLTYNNLMDKNYKTL